MWPFKRKPKTYMYSIYQYGLTDFASARDTIAPPAGKEVVAVVPSGDEHVLILWKEESEQTDDHEFRSVRDW